MRNTLKRNESNTLKCNVNNLNANFTKKYINWSLKTMHVPKLQNFIMSNISFQNITFSNVFFSKYSRTTSRLSSFTGILILPLHAIETGVDVALCCEFMHVLSQNMCYVLFLWQWVVFTQSSWWQVCWLISTPVQDHYVCVLPLLRCVDVQDILPVHSFKWVCTTGQHLMLL